MASPRSCGAIADRLSGVRTLRVLAEDTDLTVGVAGRTWIPCNGERNFPDGEVFTGPIETETNGRRAVLVPGHLQRP